MQDRQVFFNVGIDEHGQKVYQKAIDEGRLTNAGNIYYKGKKRAFLDLNGMGDGLSAFPFALSLEQSKTEKLLVDYLSENNIQIIIKMETTLSKLLMQNTW